MDGILIPALGLLVSLASGVLCLCIPIWRRFVLAALTAPFITSIVFLMGAFVLADMNPAREYGTAYIPNGTEHNPTWIHYWIWLNVVLATFTITFLVAYTIQRNITRLLTSSAD
jgi:glycerol-3-phosphate acyltransferase PlsY